MKYSKHFIISYLLYIYEIINHKCIDIGVNVRFFYQVLMLHRFVIGHWCLLAACLRKREPLLYEKENHFSRVTRSSHSWCSSSVFYIMFVYMVWFNFKRTIGILYFETQFGFAFYIDNYKMALYFSLITIYKGVERKWKIHY